MKIVCLDDLLGELTKLEMEKGTVIKNINILKNELTDTYRRWHDVENKLKSVKEEIKAYKETRNISSK